MTPDAATLAVQCGGLGIGAALGAVAQATRFCTMGALADWFSFGGPGRLLMWALAAFAAAIGTQALISAGVFDAARTVPWSPRLLWVSTLGGGAIFGAGMVLASGCPQRNLVRAGAGNLKAWVTLLVAAFSAQMTLRGLFAEARTRWFDRWSIALDGPQDIGTVLGPALGGSASAWRWAVVAVAATVLGVALWRARAALDPAHWVGGLAVGLLVPVSWWLTGRVGYLPEHPETLEPAWLGTVGHRPEGLSFASPLAQLMDLLVLWSDRNTTLSYGVTLVLGVLGGSALSALVRREWRVESFRTPRDLVDHLLGGVMMGFGGVTALGCSIGQGITGVAMLSAGAFLAVAGIVAGARGALAWQAARA